MGPALSVVVPDERHNRAVVSPKSSHRLVRGILAVASVVRRVEPQLPSPGILVERELETIGGGRLPDEQGKDEDDDSAGRKICS
jgi:hypothetical protein